MSDERLVRLAQELEWLGCEAGFYSKQTSELGVEAFLEKQREIVFRENGQSDQIVPLITPYLELPPRIDRDGRTWVYAAQEGDRPVFRPIDEINRD